LLKFSKYAHNGMDYWTTRMGPLELDSPKLPQNASFSAGQKLNSTISYHKPTAVV